MCDILLTFKAALCFCCSSIKNTWFEKCIFRTVANGLDLKNIEFIGFFLLNKILAIS